MKPLKKHPKQQRMEEMVTPDGKFIHKSIKGSRLSVTTSGKTMLSPGAKTVHVTFPIIKPDFAIKDYSGVARGGAFYPTHILTTEGEHKIDGVCTVKIKKVPYTGDKVTMTGREYLRSINDDNGFTLMPRIVWRVVAVGVLVGAVIYFLSTR